MADEAEVLRWCLDWLARLERGEEVIVNLRPDADVETEFVRFDRPRVLRILARIAADLEELARRPMDATEEGAKSEENPRARRRRRLAEPNPEVSHRFASKWAIFSLQSSSFSYLRLVSAECCTQRVS